MNFFEWACIKSINPPPDWPREQTVGTHIDVSHIASTPAGFEVIRKVKLVEDDGRRLLFEAEAHEDADLISQGKHERFVITKDKFDLKIKEEIAKKGAKPCQGVSC